MRSRTKQKLAECRLSGIRSVTCTENLSAGPKPVPWRPSMAISAYSSVWTGGAAEAVADGRAGAVA
jgi:hypothetical protein